MSLLFAFLSSLTAIRSVRNIAMRSLTSAVPSQHDLCSSYATFSLCDITKYARDASASAQFKTLWQFLMCLGEIGKCVFLFIMPPCTKAGLVSAYSKVCSTIFAWTLIFQKPIFSYTEYIHSFQVS